MTVLYVLFSIVFILSSFFLLFVVLIQKGEGGGLGGAFGGGAVDTAFGAKADMTWKRATAVAAALFMILSIALGIMDNYGERSLTQQTNGADEAEDDEAEGDGESVSGEGTLEMPEDGGDGADAGEGEGEGDGGN